MVAGSTYGWLTMWPTGAAPTVANLNYTSGLAIATLATVKLGPSCTIQVGNSPGAGDAHAGIHVILDVVGYYGPEGTVSGARFHGMVPNRIVDTRPGLQPPANSLAGALGPRGRG